MAVPKSAMCAWVTERFSVHSGRAADKLLNPEGLTKATDWAAVGFTALAAVLTFFGIKDGLLDRLLRSDPTGALWIFILVGIGVVCALFAPAVQKRATVHATPVLLVLLALGGLTLYFLRNITGEDRREGTNVVAVAAIAFLVALLIALRDVKAPAAAALLVIGVASASMGLYGAAKLSVLSKSFATDSRITATLATTESGERVNVTVLANQREHNELYVQVVGNSSSPAPGLPQLAIIGTARLAADDAGDIDASLAFPVNSPVWDTISVRACDRRPCLRASEVVQLLGGRALSSEHRVSGTLSPGATESSATATLSGSVMPPGSTMIGSIYRVGADGAETLLAQSSMTPDTAGAATWSPVNVRGAADAVLVLRYRICSPQEGNCPATPEREVASLTL
jgi:hypothetical protein